MSKGQLNMKKIIYLDNNATSQPATEVVDAMVPYLKERWGNPSSMHTFGGSVAKEIEKAREHVASLLGCKDPRQIIFTSCATESINTAVASALKTNPKKRHIITTKVEHPAVIEATRKFQKEGVETTYLSVDESGNLNLDHLKDAIRDDTALVSIMWANNETGVIFPIEKISKICSQKNILFHTDAVQAIGKVPICLDKMEINFLSLSGHKFHAPKGIGALYIKSGTPFSPLIVGGHQEHRKRAGTENVPSIVGIGKACELCKNNFDSENARIRTLRNKLEEGILKSVSKTSLNGDKSNRLVNTTNIAFEGIEGESVVLLLNEHGICVSTGSACSSDSLEPSHVLTAMSVDEKCKHGSIRFGLSRYTTEEEIEATISTVKEVITKLREISPFN